MARTTGLTGGLKTQVNNLDRLFQENQASLAQLLQARQRLIQLENAELDALWQATQAQSDLLLALGAPYLISALHQTEVKGMTNANANAPARPNTNASTPTALPGPPLPSPAPR